MRAHPLRYGAAALVAVGLCFAAAFGFGWSFQKAAFLAPVIVVASGAFLALILLWVRIAWESLRRARHPWRIVAIGVAALVLLVGLSVLGVTLPRE